MPSASRGEVWQVDLGMVAKARPAVVVNIPFRDDERAVYAIVPHTTTLRGGRFELEMNLRWMQIGLFDVQGMRNVPPYDLMLCLAALEPAQMEAILRATKIWLGIS